MANNAFFISETYLKDNSPLSRNIDMVELYPFAKTAEEIYIQEAIGTALYDDLIAKIIANTYPSLFNICFMITFFYISSFYSFLLHI